MGPGGSQGIDTSISSNFHILEIGGSRIYCLRERGITRWYRFAINGIQKLMGPHPKLFQRNLLLFVGGYPNIGIKPGRVTPTKARLTSLKTPEAPLRRP